MHCRSAPDASPVPLAEDKNCPLLENTVRDFKLLFPDRHPNACPDSADLLRDQASHLLRCQKGGRTMYDQTRHDMLPQATHDEQARQNFVQSLKEHLAMHVSPGNKSVYTRRAKPRFEKEYHRAPQDRHEVRRVMRD